MKRKKHMQDNNKLREWMFILFLVSIPVAFLGILWVGLLYFLMCILDVVDSYKRNIQRDIRGYISIILNFLISIMFCLMGIADMLLD